MIPPKCPGCLCPHQVLLGLGLSLETAMDWCHLGQQEKDFYPSRAWLKPGMEGVLPVRGGLRHLSS